MSTQESIFHYTIQFEGRGGDFCLGSISDKAGSYWSHMSNDDLASYVSRPYEHELEPGDETLQLQEWYELSDFGGVSGIENFDSLSVIDANGNTLCSLAGDQVLETVTTKCTEYEFRAHQGYMIFSRSNEKVSLSVGVNSKQPFDIRKLTLIQTDFCDREILRCIEYDDVSLELSDDAEKECGPIEVELFPPQGCEV